jgi:hypothetical protein
VRKEHGNVWATGVINAARKVMMSGSGPNKNLNLIFFYSSALNLIWAKVGLPKFEKKNQIKYGYVGFELRNDFPYWKFSIFKIKFELKYRRLLYVLNSIGI